MPNVGIHRTESTEKCLLKMPINNITQQSYANSQWHGAVIHSVTNDKERRISYGVQSATFVRTVFPGQATGTDRIKTILPTWQGPQYTASGAALSSGVTNTAHLTGRAAGSPPVPYPPGNAAAYYSNPQTRIVSNPSYVYYRAYN
jgi:hypothetical protein